MEQRSLISRCITIVTVALAWGCGTSTNTLLKKQLVEVSSQLTDLRKSQAGMAVTVEDLETRLFLVQDELDTQRKRSAVTQRQVNGLPVVRVKPQHGTQSDFDSNPKPVAQPPSGPLRFDRFDGQGNVIRAGKDAPATREEPVATVQPAPQRAPLTSNDRNAIKLYKTSFEHLKQQRYSKAIDGFRTFVEQNPTHNYADNAVYWMGECYYDRALWMKALTTFQQVIQSYPMGNKAPDAMLKIGLSHLRLKNMNQAREVLAQVTEIYPRSPIARLAQQRLSEIK